MSSKDRAKAFKQRQRDAGLEQCNVWVPAGMVADIQIVAALMRENPNLELGTLRDVITGRLVSVRK